MEAVWFYSDGGNKLGPVTASELRELALQGQLQPTSLIWKEGMGDWVPASKVKDITFAAASKAVPPPLPIQKSGPPQLRTHEAIPAEGVTKSSSQQVTHQHPNQLLRILTGRAASYGWLLLGVPLGYGISYFLQPGVLRFFTPVADYFTNARAILTAVPIFPGGGEFARSVGLTAWIGVGIGVAIVGAILLVASRWTQSSLAELYPTATPKKQRQLAILASVLAAVCICVIGITALLNSNSGRPSKSSREAVIAKMEGETRRHIQECRWWSKKPSDAELDGLIDLIVSRNDGEVVVIDDFGKNQVLTRDDINGLKRDEYYTQVSDRISKRRFYVIIGGSRRTTKAEALNELQSEVDRAEFKSGPAPAPGIHPPAAEAANDAQLEDFLSGKGMADAPAEKKPTPAQPNPPATAIVDAAKAERKGELSDSRRPLTIRGRQGIFHTRPLTVGDNWTITWSFPSHDRDADGISIWPAKGDEPLQSVDLSNRKNITQRGSAGSATIRRGGTYVIQVIALNDWTVSVSGETPAPKQGINGAARVPDVQPGEDKFMSSFLKGHGKGRADPLAGKKPMPVPRKLPAANAVIKPAPPAVAVVVIEKPAAVAPLPDEFRTYFERADATHAELVTSHEKKIADLQKSVSSDDTLAADKKRMNVELIQAKAKLTQLKLAKPFASLRRQPVIGELAALQTARVAATHDAQSVIVSVTEAPTVRLTEVDAKSLTMRVGAKVDEGEVWQVVNVDEKPNDAIAESLKVVRLVVLKRIKYADLERHRATYEAAKKATEKP